MFETVLPPPSREHLITLYQNIINYFYNLPSFLRAYFEIDSFFVYDHVPNKITLTEDTILLNIAVPSVSIIIVTLRALYC